MKQAKTALGKIKTVFGGGADAAGAADTAGMAAGAQDSGAGAEALRAARRRPFAKLTSKSGRLSTALGMANTLG